jgi:lysophospholipase L1-like esterase
MDRPRRRHLRRLALLAVLVTGVVVLATGTPTASLALVRRTARAAMKLTTAGPSRLPSRPAPTSTPTSTPSSTPTPAVSSAPPSAPSSAPGPLTVVGLGDSVPAATDCGCTSYVSLVAQQLADQQGSTAVVSNLARSGLTTAGLLEQLQDPSVRVLLGRADLVLVTIGANDFDGDELTAAACRPVTGSSCYTDALAGLSRALTGVLSQVRQLQPDSGKVVVTGYWNDFLDGTVGAGQGADYVAASDTLTLASNTVTATVSADQQAQYVDIYTPFKGADGSKDCTWLLADDGDHPNQTGHQVIAQAILSALTG